MARKRVRERLVWALLLAGLGGARGLRAGPLARGVGLGSRSRFFDGAGQPWLRAAGPEAVMGALSGQSSATALGMAKGRPGPRSKGARTAGLADLLTADEEILLARSIQAMLRLEEARAALTEELGRGPTAKEWASRCSLTPKDLKSVLNRGSLAKRAMVNANLRLVMSVARKYNHANVNHVDLVQEGTFGLMKATERFDPDRGFKFSTYATWWIRQTVMRYVHDHSRTIRLPVHMHELLNRIRRTYAELKMDMDREPTEAEVASHLDITVEKVRFARRASVNPVSIDQSSSVSKRSGSGSFQASLVDALEEKDLPPPEEIADEALRADAISGLIESLTKREGCIVRLRFGLDDGNPKTLEEIGQVMSITRERVRQIEARALQKLRQPYRNHELKRFVNDAGMEPEYNPALERLEQASAQLKQASSAGAFPDNLASLEQLLRRDTVGTPLDDEPLALQVPAPTMTAPPTAGMSAAKARTAPPRTEEDARASRKRKLMSDIEELRHREELEMEAMGADLSLDDADEWEAQQRRALAAAATKAVAEARKQKQCAAVGIEPTSATGPLPAPRPKAPRGSGRRRKAAAEAPAAVSLRETARRL